MEISLHQLPNMAAQDEELRAIQYALLLVPRQRLPCECRRERREGFSDNGQAVAGWSWLP